MDVFVLIVTYNRINYLKTLLNQLLKMNIKGIFIMDNNSSDNTNKELINIGMANSDEKEIIQENTVNQKKIIYYRNKINTGGAGGFSKGFELVKNYNWKYLWIMDDDVLPDDDCLNELIKYQNEKVKITIPNRTTNGFNERACTSINLSNPFKLFMKKKKMRNIEDKDININVVDMAFEGPLINRELIEKVGLPNKDYFLQYDDTDYATRSSKYTQIQMIINAHLYKQIIVSKNNKKYMNWKDYYAYRNDILYCRKYGKNFGVKYITPVLLWFNLTIKAILKLKFKNIKVINKAFYDGYRGKTGKTVEPGDL